MNSAQDVAQQEREMLDKYGWFSHILTDDGSAHTHGLPETSDHPDLEVRLPVNPRQRHAWLGIFAQAVKSGRRFHSDETVTDLFSVPVRVVPRTESGRPVLRVLFPDPQGRFPGDPACDPGYRDQDPV